MKHRTLLHVMLSLLLAAVCCFPFPARGEDADMVRKSYRRGELVCTYTFTVCGWGHGVGLSQFGAVEYGNAAGPFRWNYVQILMHYYPQTHMAYEEDIPDVIVRGGVSYPTRDYLAHTTMAEIGGYCGRNHREALKAQIVAAYTFVKHANYKVSAGSIAYTSMDPGELIYSCVDEVMGQYVAYADGSAAPGLFAANYPSYTASAADTWGGGYTGLEGGVYSPEKVSIRQVTMDAQDIIAIAETYNAGKPEDQKIHLTGDPSTWLEILEHDGAYSDNIGYVRRMRIGDRTMSGNSFRTLLFRVPDVPGLRCHCFGLTYDLIPGEQVQGNSAEEYSLTDTQNNSGSAD